MVCYNANDNNTTTMRVRAKNVEDKNIKFNETSKKYFIDFEVRTNNILN